MRTQLLNGVLETGCRRPDPIDEQLPESQFCGGSLMGKRITILGAAVKPDSDDV